MQLSVIQNKIHEIRGLKIMLDFDLAQLYEVETKALNVILIDSLLILCLGLL